MPSPTTVGVLPIGEFDTDAVKNEFRGMVAALQEVGGEPVVADPVADEAGARRSVTAFPGQDLDFLLLIPLRGLSAPVIETAARTSHVPCLIWPVQGRFALPSSALAVGALAEAGARVELLYARPENAEALERLKYTLRAAKAFSRVHSSRIGVLGGVFPNLISCRYDPDTVHARVGATFIPISF